MPDPKSLAHLLVEGKNDQHVVWALCKQNNLPETFTVYMAGDDAGGIDPLLKSIPVRLKVSGLRALGLVIDADQSLAFRWRSVCHQLEQFGFRDLPLQPHAAGTILDQPPLPRVGIWLMPDNLLPGMLEDFVARLIPTGDSLAVKVEGILSQLESQQLHRYSLAHRSKAYIHTWLAWQHVPGQPMGQAITAATLQHNTETAQVFTQWLLNLFDFAGNDDQPK